MRTAPDPRPAKRYRATAKEWEFIHEEFRGAPCVVCGALHQSLHHAVPRSAGGDDVTPNLIPLCGSGTTGCHGKVEARDPKARAAVRASLTLGNKLYISYKFGEQARGWLDANYAAVDVDVAA